MNYFYQYIYCTNIYLLYYGTFLKVSAKTYLGSFKNKLK